MTTQRACDVSPESALVVLGVDAWILAGLANGAPDRLVVPGEPAAGLLLMLAAASGLWALAALLVPRVRLLEHAVLLLGIALVVLVSAVVADQVPRLDAARAAEAVAMFAGVAAVPVITRWSARRSAGSQVRIGSGRDGDRDDPFG